MLKASNSNDVAGKSAKRKATPLKAIGGDEVADPKLAEARLKLKALARGDVIRPIEPKAESKSKAVAQRKTAAKHKDSDYTPRPLPAIIEARAITAGIAETPTVNAALAEPRPVTPAIAPPERVAQPKPAVQPKPRRRFDPLHFATIMVAIVLAGIAAYFSVSGMTRIFPGAEIPVIIMASTMEAGKLAGAAWLSRNWIGMPFVLRMVLAGLVLILALINAVGVFGQLSAAHLNPSVTAVNATETEAANQSAKIDAQQRVISDLNRRIAQIDTAIEEATKRGHSVSAMEMAKEQRRNRADLVQQRAKEDETLIEMRTTQARITGERRKVAADVGVLEYAAALFGVDREQMIQLLILGMVLSCDPLSITLVVATAANRQSKAKPQSAPDDRTS